MIDSVTIKSSRYAAELKLSEPRPSGEHHEIEYLRVSVNASELAASSSEVYILEPHSLAAFFSDVAAHRNGWDGVKEWHSVENDFALSCAMDAMGHVAMEVTLKSGPYADAWHVRLVMSVDVGQLEEIAAKVKQFLGT